MDDTLQKQNTTQQEQIANLQSQIQQLIQANVAVNRENFILKNQKYSYRINCCVCFGGGYLHSLYGQPTICPACGGSGKIVISPLFRLDKTAVNHLKEFIRTGQL